MAVSPIGWRFRAAGLSTRGSSCGCRCIAALADQIPYAVGLIDLTEGIRIVSTISGCDVDDIHAGMPVRAAFPETSDAPTIFSFVPA